MKEKIKKEPSVNRLRKEDSVVEVMKQNHREENKIHNDKMIKTQINITPEQNNKIEREYERANEYISIKEKQIEDSYNHINSNFRKVADYLYMELYKRKEIEKSELQRVFKISMSQIQIYLSKLNFLRSYPITIIPVYAKVGFIQAITKNQFDAIEWEKRKFRTIESMEYVKEKGEMGMMKLGERIANAKKQKVKQVVQNKKGNKE